jgi:transketolase
VIGIQTFGASAPLKALQKHFGIEADEVIGVAKEVLRLS